MGQVNLYGCSWFLSLPNNLNPNKSSPDEIVPVILIFSEGLIFSEMYPQLLTAKYHIMPTNTKIPIKIITVTPTSEVIRCQILV
jgi:hypothetical protein